MTTIGEPVSGSDPILSQLLPSWTWDAVVVAALAMGSCAGSSTAGSTDTPAGSPPRSVTPSVSDATAVTYYVRTDGGDANQCTGRADAPYPGSGTSRNCAWRHPFMAMSPDGGVRIAGGDTLLIASGSYMIGPGAPGTDACRDRHCVMPPVPSGRSMAARTRILGKSCSAMPQLWGTGDIDRILNLEGSSNVEIGCLEITDHDDCVSGHSNDAAACPATSPYGDYADVGVFARASSNVWLHDLDIHGLAHTGIRAGGLRDWTVERVRLIANGRAGWSGDLGPGSSNSGQIILRNVEIAWNGCGERWQTRTPWACWAQRSGGYGDGLGTTHTGGQWLIEDTFVHHNTSDGLDLRYMDGAPTSSVTVRRLHALGNAGNQLKIRGNALVENSVIVGNCGNFSGKYFMVDGDSCRAGGNAIQLVLTADDSVTVRHNTIAGEGGVLIGATEGDDSARIRIENNVLVGYPTFLDSRRLTSVFYANNAPAHLSWAGNLVWNVKGDTCPPDSICGKNPKLADMSLASFDAEPLRGSPVIDRVRSPAGLSRDFRHRPRPADRNADIGAIEAQVR